ncbi:cupin-like domain-containing protein [Microbulbifer yueqingensis]|uniref:Cupin-like domain-containing protein n=1 Tax=Microbulbifer yueqingensis TaxID=658219 RepID=A0A1G9DEA0_9GAMM|nr:cupin-like domain-containing protein [Microbulbifer yueqingensis]SDK62208.1 Cupin-like domain-containing protein [Microbulbifer yueqingensis]
MNYPEFIPPVETRDDVPAEQVADIIEGRTTPLLMKGALAHWPLVQAAKSGALADYLASFDQGRPLVVFRADAEAQGRIFYNEAMDGFNFTRGTGQLVPTLREIEAQAPGEDCCYVGSTPIDHHLPGLREQNDLELAGRQPLVSMWFGNRTRIAAHFDLPENLACVVAGRRRFTLFPPEQVANLYPGPLDFNPAGQAISMVDFYAPDFERFPRYREALAAATVAEMSPGDLLFVPSMWWHQVEGLDDLNMLVNYWWRSTPTWTGLPHDAMLHALLSIGTLPEAQRQAWGQLFEHFVVHREEAVAHIPPERRGVLGEVDREMAVQLKKLLIEKLQRMP